MAASRTRSRTHYIANGLANAVLYSWCSWRERKFYFILLVWHLARPHLVPSPFVVNIFLLVLGWQCKKFTKPRITRQSPSTDISRRHSCFRLWEGHLIIVADRTTKRASYFYYCVSIYVFMNVVCWWACSTAHLVSIWKAREIRKNKIQIAICIKFAFERFFDAFYAVGREWSERISNYCSYSVHTIETPLSRGWQESLFLFAAHILFMWTLFYPLLVLLLPSWCGCSLIFFYKWS